MIMIFPYVFCGAILIYAIFWSVEPRIRWSFFRFSTIILTIISGTAYVCLKIDSQNEKTDKLNRKFIELLKEGKK